MGTWVGAVLAFYYSSNALRAGSATTLNAVRATTAQITPETAVTSIMILFKNIQPRVNAADTAAAKLLKVKDLYAQIQSSGHSRVPIFTGQVCALRRSRT